jgi:hypothetical protein
MKAKTTKRPTRKYWIVRVDNVDVRVLARTHAQARRNARAGCGRVVGVYFC